jgi:hypothetical protein
MITRDQLSVDFDHSILGKRLILYVLHMSGFSSKSLLIVKTFFSAIRLTLFCLCFFVELLLRLLCIKQESSKSKINVKKNLHEEMVKKTR